MGKKVESKVKHCSQCGCNTLHHKNAKEMSFGESIAHLVLVIFTAGVWLLPLFLLLVWNSISSFGGWVCSKCGK